jgi:endonuclease/exonuclease/phosphatase family metal-dependent hydrolase
VPQAEFLAPEGYESVYRTNAYTKDGEHGNALLTRWPVIGHQHEDISTTASSSAACCMWSWNAGRACTPSWCTWA